MIALAVGAERLVQGSVRRQGDRVLFSVQIVDGLSDRIRWSRHFEGRVEEIVLLEDRIARAIASKLGAGTSSTSRPRRGAELVDPVAHDLFLRGRFELDRRSEGGIRLARAHFTRSLERDSTFAAPGDWFTHRSIRSVSVRSTERVGIPL